MASSTAAKKASSWKDTVFFFHGDLKTTACTIIDAAVSASSSSSSSITTCNVSRSVVWEGARISIPNCPDARRAATPIRFLDENPQFKFSGKVSNTSNTTTPVNTLKNEKKKFDTEAPAILKLKAAQQEHGDGFELDGEEEEEVLSSSSSSDQHEANKRYQDKEHLILFQEGLYKKQQIVVGRGFNELFGSFIEVGWLREQHELSVLEEFMFATSNEPNAKPPPPIMKLLLVRRYLKDNDERSRWSLTMLRSQIELELPFSPLGEGPWSRILDFVGAYSRPDPGPSWSDIHPAWRTLVFHSELWGLHQQEQKQVEPETIICYSTGLPAYVLARSAENLSHGGRVLDFRLGDDDGATYFFPNTFWENQCWGCGKIAKPDNLLRFKLEESELYGPWTHVSFVMGEYCGTACIGPTIPEIARSSARWSEDIGSTLVRSEADEEETQQEQAQNAAAAVGYGNGGAFDDDDYNAYISLVSRGHQAFWDSLNDEQLQAMKDAGWQTSQSAENSLWELYATEPIPTEETDDASSDIAS